MLTDFYGNEAKIHPFATPRTQLAAISFCRTLHKRTIIRFHFGRRGSTTAAKGQLISKCPYEKSVSSKIPTKT